MDIFFLQLVLLFTPGIVWERIDNRCGVNRPQAQFDVVRRAFGFGLSAYGVCFLGLAVLNGLWSHITKHTLYAMHMAVLSKDSYTLEPSILWQTFGVTTFAVLFATAWLFVTNRKWPIRFMQYIGATKRFGDEDVWDFTFNSRDAATEYVHVRDIENDLTWSGWVDLFSETGRTRELVLRDVQVSDKEGVLYETPRVYLARSSDALTIEFPYRGSDQGAGYDGRAIEAAESDDPGRLQQEDPKPQRRLHDEGRSEPGYVTDHNSSAATRTDRSTDASADASGAHNP